MIARLTALKPAFLASVTSAEEAELACDCGGDIIDCKDPRNGALGALSPSEIRRIVSRICLRAPVSATIGDHPEDGAGVVAIAEETAALGVDIVKVGFFGGARDTETAVALAAAQLGRARLFAVLMADRVHELSLLPALARAGFLGVMLDTADKLQGSLSHLKGPDELNGFLSAARAHGLMVGLAGSLRLDDVAMLAALEPDMLGFRGALCAAGRTGSIDRDRVKAIRHALDGARIATAKPQSTRFVA